PPPTFPVPVVRSAGVWFPPTGKFYNVGGRSADVQGSALRNPYAYDPATNSWSMSSAQMVDGQTNNVVAEYLTGPNGPRIYIVGGSEAGAVTVTNRVQVFDPIADTITELATDPWPALPTGQVLPGGSAVFNNKLYI